MKLGNKYFKWEYLWIWGTKLHAHWLMVCESPISVQFTSQTCHSVSHLVFHNQVRNAHLFHSSYLSLLY